ncbi:MAG: ABC transporter permease subunit [Clostridiales bacterium]|nr:ABC transporter permease subunit [Clostridiales bacterium]
MKPARQTAARGHSGAENFDEKMRGARKVFLKNYQLLILILPAFAATFIFSYIPMYGVQIAFKNFRPSLGIWASEWVGLEHFVRLFQFPNFLPMLRNTLTITLYTLAVFPIEIIVALMLNELGSLKFKKTVQMVSYAPHFLSTVVLCGIVKLFLGRANGVVNNLLAFLGGDRIDFLALPEAFASIYVWSGVWQNVGWGTIIYLAALAGVSSELVEAARMDGAGRLRIIWHVNIPALTPTIVILFIMSAGSIMSLGYEKIFLLQNNLNLPASRVISTYVYDMGILRNQFSYATAIDFFNNAVNIATLMAVNALADRLTGIGLW